VRRGDPIQRRDRGRVVRVLVSVGDHGRIADSTAMVGVGDCDGAGGHGVSVTMLPPPADGVTGARAPRAEPRTRDPLRAHLVEHDGPPVGESRLDRGARRCYLYAMRMLVVALVVFGCRGSSPVGGNPLGSNTPPGATASVDLAALADEACACTDAPCRDQVHDRWNATPAPRAAGDPVRMSPQEIAAEVAHDAAYDATRKRIYNCLEPEHSAPGVTARVKAFAERACACARSDVPCLDTVKAAFDRYLEIVWMLQDDYTPADKQTLENQMRKFEICRQVGPT